MELAMKTLAIALTLAAAFAVPALAGTSAVNLPHLTFPDPVVTPSTKSCVETATNTVCPTDK